MTTAAVVLVTMGDRDDSLARALASIRMQHGPTPEVIVVGNGCRPRIEDPEVRVVALAENVGVSRGRNAGWEVATADIVFFLDDDARYESPAIVTDTLSRFASSPDLAVVSFRIVDETGRVVRKHIPMLRKGHPESVALVTTFLGGACAIRRRVLEEEAGFPDEFFYGLEETDFSWRVLDRDMDILYAGDLAVVHPRVPTAQRSGAIRNTARNRVLLARRRLPVLLAAVYLPIRCVLSLFNVRSFGDFGALFAGYRAGFRDDRGTRRPMRWATAWRMTRLGRPPVI